jgi:hypothetical protein
MAEIRIEAKPVLHEIIGRITGALILTLCFALINSFAVPDAVAQTSPALNLKCLVKSERAKATPDLTKLNWRGISEKEMEVCLQQILPSLGDRPIVEAWIKSLGFMPERMRNCDPRDKTIECVNFSRRGDLSTSIFWPRPIRAYSQMISVRHKDDKIVSVSFVSSRL